VASIKKLPSGKYRVRWRDRAGHEKGVTLSTKRAALVKKAEVEVDASRGVFRNPAEANQALGVYAAEPLEATTLAPSTRATYETHLRLYVLPGLGGEPLGGVDAGILRRFYAKLRSAGTGESTIEHVHRLVTRTLNRAVREGIIPSNPASHATPARVQRKPPRVLEPSEIEDILAAVHRDHRIFVLTAAYTGLRFGELAGLRCSRVHVDDPDNAWLEVVSAISEVRGHLLEGTTKTGAYRQIPLPRFLALELRDQVDLAEWWASVRKVRPGQDTSADPLVFASRWGGPLSRRRFRARVWAPAVAEAGITPAPTFHALRHSHTAQLVSQGVHPKVIQARLGHASITTTLNVYGGILPGDSAEVARKLHEGRRAVVRARQERARTDSLAPVASIRRTRGLDPGPVVARMRHDDQLAEEVR
jgi:integrase